MTSEELEKEEVAIAKLISEKYIDPTGKALAIADGISDAALYLKAPLKILWILKEPWDGDWDNDGYTGGGWHLCRNLLKEKPEQMLKGATFRNIYYITHALFTGVRDWDSIPYPKNDPNSTVTLQSIAFINVKKLPGPRYGSIAGTVLSSYEQGKEIIRKQIKTYKPDVIFGCAPHFPRIVEDYAGEQIERKKSGHALHCQSHGMIFIQLYHPAQWSTIKHRDYVIDALNAYDTERNLI